MMAGGMTATGSFVLPSCTRFVQGCPPSEIGHVGQVGVLLGLCHCWQGLQGCLPSEMQQAPVW